MNKGRLTAKDIRRLVALADGLLDLGDDDANVVSACDVVISAYVTLAMKGYVAEARAVMRLMLFALAKLEPDKAERVAIMTEGLEDIFGIDADAPPMIVTRGAALRWWKAVIRSRRARLAHVLTHAMNNLYCVEKIEQAAGKLRMR